MRPRLAAAIVATVLAAGPGVACADAPDPGDLAAFCSLLESGTGLTNTPTAEDLQRLATVAPPAIRSTIEALQSRAQDFDELLAVEPVDLAKLFEARFDPKASRERAALDAYAESSCGIAVDRPPATRWNNYVRQNHEGAPWADLVTAQFEVAGDSITTATVAFGTAPDPLSLVEDICRALSGFLIAEGDVQARVRVLVGSVVALEYDSPAGECRLP